MQIRAKKKCGHLNTTLVQVNDPSVGWFMAYQCDDCGQMTRQPVSYDDLQQTNVPWRDEDMYDHATTETTVEEQVVRTLSFINKAIR